MEATAVKMNWYWSCTEERRRSLSPYGEVITSGDDVMSAPFHHLKECVMMSLGFSLNPPQSVFSCYRMSARGGWLQYIYPSPLLDSVISSNFCNLRSKKELAKKQPWGYITRNPWCTQKQQHLHLVQCRSESSWWRYRLKYKYSTTETPPGGQSWYQERWKSNYCWRFTAKLSFEKTLSI